MKLVFAAVAIVSSAFLASCDLRSGTAKEEMEKFSGSPTPTISPAPTPMPIDPAEIVKVDTTLDGDILTVNGQKQNKTITCSKFDQVMINGNGSVVTANGACRQIIVNGDENQITADAAMEFVFNGTGNSLRYARYANGKQPTVTENQAGNVIEKIAFEPKKIGALRSKNEK